MMQEHADRALMFAMYGSSAVTVAVPEEPLTLDKLNAALRELRRSMPKPATFLSTRQFPGTDSLKIEGSEEDFVVAHPMFWARLQHELRRDEVATNRADILGIARPMFGIQIIELDGPFHDTEAGRARQRYIEGIWEKLIETIKVACVELPAWLKAPPRVTKHG